MCNGTLSDTTVTSALVIMHNAQCQSKPHIQYMPVALSNLFNIDWGYMQLYSSADFDVGGGTFHVR